jgi:hypothetical protein
LVEFAGVILVAVNGSSRHNCTRNSENKVSKSVIRQSYLNPCMPRAGPLLVQRLNLIDFFFLGFLSFFEAISFSVGDFYFYGPIQPLMCRLETHSYSTPS